MGPLLAVCCSIHRGIHVAPVLRKRRGRSPPGAGNGMGACACEQSRLPQTVSCKRAIPSVRSRVCSE